MLRLYVSYASADKPHLDKVLRWLRPLKERYALELGYASPGMAHRPHPVSGAGMLYPVDWSLCMERLEQSHIYLFLVSPNSLKTTYIEQEEVSRAVQRYRENGPDLVRIFPVLLSPAPGKEHSALSAFPALGGPNGLLDPKAEDEGFRQLIVTLGQAVETLQRNWLEERFRLGQKEEDAGAPMMRAAPGGLKPLPGWAGAAMLMAVFYMVTSFYLRSCAPRMYHLYVPKTMPYQPAPEPYWRENPVEQPADVPPRPAE